MVILHLHTILINHVILFFNEAYRIRLVKLDNSMMDDCHENSGIDFIGSKAHRKTEDLRKIKSKKKKN